LWKLITWIIETFLAGSFIVQRGWGCSGCLIGILGFIGFAFLFMYFFPCPDGFTLVPSKFALALGIFFTVAALILGNIFAQKSGADKGFSGRNRPD
jgi:hypothetical protein